MLQTILHSSITRGAIAGIVSAAAVDFHAFRSWKSWHDLGTYSWGLAAFRWFQGAVVGAIVAAGYGGLVG